MALTSLEYKVLRITNTYDWIITTDASRIKRRAHAVISTVSNECLIDGPLFKLTVSVLQLCLPLDVLLVFLIELYNGLYR